MAKISWSDDLGPAELSNTMPYPGNRFADWTPNSKPFAHSGNALADARLYIFEFRVDHTAAFEIRGIPTSSLPLLERLQLHLRRGGTVSVTTDDYDSNVYATCNLAPDSDFTYSMSDPPMLEYTASVQLLNVADPRVPLLCRYGVTA